jgi:hypothetical protein
MSGGPLSPSSVHRRLSWTAPRSSWVARIAPYQAFHAQAICFGSERSRSGGFVGDPVAVGADDASRGTAGQPIAELHPKTVERAGEAGPRPRWRAPGGPCELGRVETGDVALERPFSSR